MRKTRKQLLSQATAVALSLTMTVPSMAAPLADPLLSETDAVTKKELLVEDGTEEEEFEVAEEETAEAETESAEEESVSEEETKAKEETEATAPSVEETETVADDDEVLADIEITDDVKEEKDDSILDQIVDGVKEVLGIKYEKFASDDFILWWFDEATDEDKEAWFESITKYDGDDDKATATEAKYPSYMSDEFDDWFNEKGLTGKTLSYTLEGEEVEVPELDKSALYAWIQHVSMDDAFSFINGVLGNYYVVLSGNADAGISLANVIGDLWPETWGKGADYTTHGSGVKEDPYVLDSVEDLRAFAKDVANGQYQNDEYFLLKHGTYDLGGCWIPIGFNLNNGDNSYVPFSGHFAGEDGAVIKNLGFKASSTLGVSSDLASAIRSQKYCGFFGILDQATVNNIEIQTSGTMEVNSEMAGVLAGYAVDSAVKEIEINSSKIKGTTYVGGLIGRCESSSAADSARDMVIEDITCAKVAVYTTTAVELADDGVEGHGAVGGVVGLATNTSIVDTTVTTNTGTGNHIYGKHAFVGGIVGVSENSDVLNSYVKDGEIGYSDAFAVGGIVGGYKGGAVKVARFSGTIRRPETTNNYSACFIGYRVGGAGFVYGLNGDIAYLFANTKAKADTGICGSRIEDDGDYDLDAYIGYWHEADTYCTIVSGDNQEIPEERFYEVLEDGILNAKLGTNSSAGGYQNTDTINHYTADKTGNPTRGYLLTIENPLVDGVQAAEITAYVNGSYKKTVSADDLGAFAPGDQVYISFTDLSDGNAYYRLDDDEPTNPWYSYYQGDNRFYVFDNYDPDDNDPTVTGLRANGGWVLTMPESDTVIGAEYEKVAEAVTTSPQKLTFDVTQVRSGDRSNPETKWVVTAYNDKGAVITDYNGTNWDAIDPTNANALKSDDVRFWIGSLVNGAVNTKFNLSWKTSNTGSNGIITDTVADSGLTNAKTAYINLNLYDSAINDQIDELVAKQHADGDKDSISTIEPYYYHSLVTAVADVEDVDDKKNPPKGYCDITIKLSIKDETTTKINGVALNNNEMTYNVVRYLEGDRSNPSVRYTINGEDASSVTDISKLSATFNPDYFSSSGVHWYLSDEETKDAGVESDFNSDDDGTLNVAVSGEGTKAYYNSTVTLKGMSKTSSDNSFIVSVNNKEDAQYTSQMMANPGKTSTYEKYVKVTAKDDVNNSVTDTCHVTVNYKTVDDTEIMPTAVNIDNKSNINGYNIYYTFKGSSKSEITARTIRKTDVANTKVTNGEGEQLTAAVSPTYDNSKSEFQPFDKGITWELANNDENYPDLDPYDVLNIDKYTGQIVVRGYSDSTDENDNGYSPWIQSLISEGRLNGTTVTVRVIARSTRDNTITDFKDIKVKFAASTMENEDTDLTYDVVYTKTVGSNVASKGITEAGTWSGDGSLYISATGTGSSEAPVFTLSDTAIAKIIEQEATGKKTVAEIAPVTSASWIKGIIADRKNGNKGTKTATLTSQTTNGASLSTSPVTVNFRYDGVDLTASAVSETPAGFGSEYVPSMASVKDRDITMNVVATQGNYSQDNPGTRDWKYGIIKLSNTTYSAAGVLEDDATYTLTGDLADYAKIENGCLVPTKGLWESNVIGKDLTKGSISGIVTASKDCSGITVTDSYAVTIDFRYDKAVLDQHEASFDVVYTEDSRTNSKLSHWTGDDYIQLKATISDESGQDVTPVWESSDTDIVTVDKDGRVYVNEDTWIKDIIDAARNDYANEVHEGTKTVTVTAKHPATGATADTCVFTVSFRYDQAIMDHNEDVFTVIKTQTSRTINPSSIWRGNDIRKINSKMHVGPGMSTDVYYSSEDKTIVTVDDAGNIQPVINADWMNEIIANRKWSGQKKVAVNVDNDALTVRDSDNITVNFIYEDVELSENARTLNITVTATGSSSSPKYTVEGDLSAKLSAALHSADASETKVVYSSADSSVLAVDQNGKLTVKVPAADKMQGRNFTDNASSLLNEAIKHAWNANSNYITTREVVITGASEDGRMADQCRVTLNVKFINKATSSSNSSGGSSGGGGGGGGTSTGVTPSGTTTVKTGVLPNYVKTGGQWSKNSADRWLYTNGRTFTDEWAAVANPYADASKGQETYSWFHFGKDSFMTTGWYDEGGDTYYLHPVSDGTQGRMYTGWHWIDSDGDGKAECYYFETESNGHKGSLYKSTTTPDGYTVNEKGQWTQNGQVITRDANALQTTAETPSYVSKGGTWMKAADRRWTYSDSKRTYKNEWAAVSNPYADASKGQETFSWFHFGADGIMTTGWFTDTNGDTFYLHNSSDGTLGRMYTGWNWIDDNNDGVYECYYFETASNGHRGRLYKNTSINGYTVNAKGQWTQNGKVVTKTASTR